MWLDYCQEPSLHEVHQSKPVLQVVWFESATKFLCNWKLNQWIYFYQQPRFHANKVIKFSSKLRVHSTSRQPGLASKLIHVSKQVFAQLIKATESYKLFDVCQQQSLYAINKAIETCISRFDFFYQQPSLHIIVKLTESWKWFDLYSKSSMHHAFHESNRVLHFFNCFCNQVSIQ